ncbi:hypothetical protein [Virgibacillus siamensis]|uniref:hypothetical protein n=1 Tax=Virgibacillus siamensis TaxID=480071 RepID=UPI000984DBD7|nr:hypothetical protein [Virgibacillus siamensis]
MGIIVMFVALATLTPFLFIHLNKKIPAVLQAILVFGMWFYYLEAAFFVAPGAFSITWFMFYGSLILAEVAWIMFIIQMVKFSMTKAKTYREQRLKDPISEL